MEIPSGEISDFMKNKTYINSGAYDCITIIASAAQEIPGVICIRSGNFVKDKQFRYSKCELFTVDLQKEKTFQISMQDVKVCYCYLFKRGSSAPIQQINLKDGAEDTPSVVYKNQNVFHYSAPTGWLNDPVGLCFYHGLYHMFYQFNPASQKWGDSHWGHVTSRDLLHWRGHPVEFCPQPELISTPLVRGGAFSGTALVEQERLHLFFTRHVGDLQKKHCMEYTVTADSVDGFSFSEERTIVKDLPSELGENFRDPKVWREGDEWLMLTGTETPEGAAIAIHRSKDLTTWEYRGIFYREKERGYLRAECPSIIKISGKYVLIVGYHNREKEKIRRDTVYYIGSFENYRFHVEHKGLLDYGKDFYAAQIFAGLERAVLIAWVNDRHEYHIEKLCRSNGAMSLPRKLWIEEERLYSYPTEELVLAETKEACFTGPFTLKDGRGHLHFDFTEEPSGTAVFAGSESGRVSVTVSKNRIQITMDDETCGLETDLQELDVYLDNSLLEIFINHGMYAFTRRYERYETNYEVNAAFEPGCRAAFYKIEPL